MLLILLLVLFYTGARSRAVNPVYIYPSVVLLWYRNEKKRKKGKTIRKKKKKPDWVLVPKTQVHSFSAVNPVFRFLYREKRKIFRYS